MIIQTIFISLIKLKIKITLQSQFSKKNILKLYIKVKIFIQRGRPQFDDTCIVRKYLNFKFKNKNLKFKFK